MNASQPVLSPNQSNALFYQVYQMERMLFQYRGIELHTSIYGLSD